MVCREQRFISMLVLFRQKRNYSLFLLSVQCTDDILYMNNDGRQYHESTTRIKIRADRYSHYFAR